MCLQERVDDAARVQAQLEAAREEEAHDKQTHLEARRQLERRNRELERRVRELEAAARCASASASGSGSGSGSARAAGKCLLPLREHVCRVCLDN